MDPAEDGLPIPQRYLAILTLFRLERAANPPTVTADGYLKSMTVRQPRIPPPLSASARIYHPDPAPSRYDLDAVQSAWSDAQWRRWSYSGEPRSACGRFPLPASRQAPMSPRRGTASPACRE